MKKEPATKSPGVMPSQFIAGQPSGSFHDPLGEQTSDNCARMITSPRFARNASRAVAASQ
jgi:hypothetical protein